MNMKDLRAHFGKSAAHHEAMHKIHSGFAKRHQAEAEYHKSEGDERLHKFHAGEAADHEAAAGHHLERAEHFKSLHASKAAEAESLEKFDINPAAQGYLQKMITKMVAEAIGSTVVPAAVSAVAPTPPANDFGITAVIRPGQRPITKTDIPAVDSQFESIVKVD